MYFFRRHWRKNARTECLYLNQPKVRISLVPRNDEEERPRNSVQHLSEFAASGAKVEMGFALTAYPIHFSTDVLYPELHKSINFGNDHPYARVP
jgi:hypothetical protein